MKKNLKNLYNNSITVALPLLFLFVPTISLADANYIWPLKEKTHLTGSFGECRKTHLHTGIDISTNGRKGMPVYSSAAGTLYRLKTQHIGFGKTIYIQLKDGKFLIYAHLNKFSPSLEKLLEKTQQKKNKFVVDFKPKKNISIEKGELIGYSGDSGGVPPHLHLELRNKNDQPINPLKNGFHFNDTTPPIINGFALCDPITTYIQSKHPIKEISPNKYIIESILTIENNLALAISTFDESKQNKLGIYSIEVKIDEKSFFEVQINKFSYKESYNNFFTYNKELYLKNRDTYYHLFRAFDNKLPFYSMDTNGILDLDPGTHNLILKVSDEAGNISTLSATLDILENKYKTKEISENNLWKSKDGIFSIKIPYKNQHYPLGISISQMPKKHRTKEIMPIDNLYNVSPAYAVFKKAEISFKNLLNDKRIGIYSFNNNNWKFLSSEKTTSIRSLGKFSLAKDIKAPSIRILSTRPIFRAKITDNGSGIDYKSLSLIVNGKKTIGEILINQSEFVCDFKDKSLQDNNKAIIKVKDRAGNYSEKKLIF